MKKALGPVVAMALFLVIAVVAGIGFQVWLEQYSSDILIDVESQDAEPLRIGGIEGTVLYVINDRSKSVLLSSVKVGGVDCSVSKNMTPGVNTISVARCLNELGTQEVVLVSSDSVASKKIRVEQVAETAFVSVWKTDNTGTSNDDEITLPVFNGGTYNFTVDWGDGSSDDITAFNDAAVTHTYSSAGTYTVRINGTIRGFRFGDAGDEEKLLDIKNWGPLHLHEGNGYFYGASNLRITATDILNTTGTTNFANAFRGASSLTSVPFMGDWDMSAASSFSNMFNGATNFNEDIANWDTSNVTTMLNAFRDASSFNQEIDSWDLRNLTSLAQAFLGASSFNQNLNSWNTSAVTDMSYTFNQATNFNGQIGNWDTSSVIDMQNMFRDASSFNQDIDSWDTSNVTDMQNMFREADSFNQSLNSWDLRNVSTMLGAFYGTAAFNGDITNWDTENVTDMSHMFRESEAFNQDIGSWNLVNVTDISNMFLSAAVFNQDVGAWDTGNVTQMINTFRNTSFDQDIGTWDVRNLTTANSMFLDTTLSTANYNALLIGWEGQSVQDTVPLHGGDATYSAGAAASARQALIDDHSWTINDGGQE